LALVHDLFIAMNVVAMAIANTVNTTQPAISPPVDECDDGHDR